MDSRERIKTCFERNARAVELRPSVGQGTARTRVRIRENLTCDIEDGRWKLVADMSEKYGSSGAGPDPGVYGRSAFGSCLAIGYMMWAAKLGIPISGLEIEVQADYDTRGIYGVDDVHPGYKEVRYIVTVESDATEAEIEHFLDLADARSPWYDDLARPLTLKREFRVVSPAD